MALVATKTNEQRLNDAQNLDRWLVEGTLAFDNLYQTNGMALNLAQIGLKTLNNMSVFTASGYLFEYVSSTGKVKVYAFNYASTATAGAAVEVAVNTDLSTLTTVPFKGIGTKTA